jgi:RNA polymerase sigma-70 factor, ECF subfamily
MAWGRKALAEVTEGLRSLYPRLWRYCLALTGSRDRADDLAQAACLRAIENADKYQPGTRLDFWLFRMTQRLWLNELRAAAVRRGGGLLAAEDIDLPDHRPDPEMNLLAREVLDAVMALPEAQRATVILVYVEGFSYKEAAEVLEIPVGTVMSRLAAARGKINAVFGPRQEHLGRLG